MTSRIQVLAEFPMRAADGSTHTGQLVQPQTWHPSISNPRWIDGKTFVRVNAEELDSLGDNRWRNPDTGEEFIAV